MSEGTMTYGDRVEEARKERRHEQESERLRDLSLSDLFDEYLEKADNEEIEEMKKYFINYLCNEV